ncbi:hypothetical protein [Streptomyces sp. NPDC088736]|uniref:hypothetical protein n=1 Tax=Streptomyces sp. NPDC088736 TaxID=3365881 RepID=UPI0038027ACE
MTYREDAHANLRAARDTLAELTGTRTTTDVTIANAARAQAITTAALVQAVLALDDTLSRQTETETTS